MDGRVKLGHDASGGSKSLLRLGFRPGRKMPPDLPCEERQRDRRHPFDTPRLAQSPRPNGHKAQTDFIR